MNPYNKATLMKFSGNGKKKSKARITLVFTILLVTQQMEAILQSLLFFKYIFNICP